MSASRSPPSPRATLTPRALAAQLIEIDYEPLPAVLSHRRRARSPMRRSCTRTARPTSGPWTATRTATWSGNRRWPRATSTRAWARCDVIVEGTWETQAQHHVYMETERRASPRSTPPAASRFSRPASRCTTSRQRVADELGDSDVPDPRVRYRASAAASAASTPATSIRSRRGLPRATGRPVKLVLSRTQDMEIQRSRHPARIRMKTGARRDGTIVARDVRDHARRRRLCRREPERARVRDADGARARTASRTCASAAMPSTPTSCAPAPSAASATRRRPSRANRRSTSWRRGSASTRSSCA